MGESCRNAFKRDGKCSSIFQAFRIIDQFFRCLQLTALDFKPYQLPGQYERTPIGGKLLFQRWHDSAGNRDLMKIEYVYQSTEQLRNADALTLQAPPQRVTLALNGCPVDDQGFCPLETFKKVINEAAK